MNEFIFKKSATKVANEGDYIGEFIEATEFCTRRGAECIIIRFKVWDENDVQYKNMEQWFLKNEDNDLLDSFIDALDCEDVTISEINIFMNSAKDEHILSIHVKANAQNYVRTFPMSVISLGKLIELHSQNANGIIFVRDRKLFYGDVPKIIEFKEFNIDLSQKSYKCISTMAFMEQVQIFQKTYPDIRISFDTPYDSNPFLTVTTKFVEKEFIQIIREGKCNPNQPRKEQLFERITKVWDEINQYPMYKVSEKELMNHRLSKIPGVVYKKGSTLFYTTIPNTLNLNTDFERSNGKHACGEHCTMVCRGCPRTRDFTVNSQIRFGKTFARAVNDSWRIEKYPFVLEGIESFNMGTTSEACLIMSCENYKTRYKGNPSAVRPTKDLKLNLANLYWDDFNGDYTEMRNRIKSQTP